MSLHIFRPNEPPSDPSPPVGATKQLGQAVAVRRVLTLLWRICRSPRGRRLAAYLVALVGLVVQGVLLLTVGYLVDLSLSLMELWAELARKHLELTL